MLRRYVVMLPLVSETQRYRYPGFNQEVRKKIPCSTVQLVAYYSIWILILQYFGVVGFTFPQHVSITQYA